MFPVTLGQSPKLNTAYLRSALAFKFNDKFSIGIGLDVVRSTARWNYNRNFSMPLFSVEKDILAQIEASGNSISFAAGVLFRPSDKIGIGIRYQHKVNLVLEGMTKFRRATGGSLPHPTNPKIRLRDLMEDFYTYEAVISFVTMPAE